MTNWKKLYTDASIMLDKYQNDVVPKYRKKIEELEAKAGDKWVPTAERLPNEFVSVLVFTPSDHPLPVVKEAYLANGCWFTKSWIYSMKEITHWMEMPEPPKGENNA